MRCLKKFITLLIVLIAFTVPNLTVYAKSYSIDDVQIRGMVYPDGSILMNEIFTYTLNGSYSEFIRSFPKKHANQIDAFEAYFIHEENPVAGEITTDVLSPLNVVQGDSEKVITINEENTTVSVFYMYIMKNVVKSYDSYSDIDITFFEDGSNHDIDFNNVKVTYVFPTDVGDDKIHGFMHDRNAEQPKVYKDGIVFSSSKSAAYSETSTRVLFPSSIMTAQKYRDAPMSFEDAIAQEKKKMKSMNSMLSLIPMVGKTAGFVSILFIIFGVIIVFLLRQRWISFSSNRELILQTDPVYLFFVDRNGGWHPKSFVAGLFSIVEKKHAVVNFESVGNEQEKTLTFQLNESKASLLPYEALLVKWLFKSKTDKKAGKFNLNELVVKPIEGKKQFTFESSHWEWNREVKELMIEAGTFSDKLASICKSIIATILFFAVMGAFIVDLRTGWDLIFTFLIGVFILSQVIRNPSRILISLFFLAFMFITSARIIDDELSGIMMLLILAGAFVHYAIPKTMVSSINSLRVRMSIISFRSQVRRGIPRGLTEDEQNRWLARAYLLNNSKSKLPSITTVLTNDSPLAEMFAEKKDPLHTAMKTWGTSHFPIKNTDGNSSTNYDTGGGYSGGGDSGGGGAGAR